MTPVRRMDRGEALRLILMLYLVAWCYHCTHEAEANHAEAFPIVKEKGLCDTNRSKACRYLLVEECTGLQAPLPRLARTEAFACPNGDPAGCLPNGLGGAYLPDHGGVVVLPMGNDRWWAHESLHHLLRLAGIVDWREHHHAEWSCETP